MVQEARSISIADAIKIMAQDWVKQSNKSEAESETVDDALDCLEVEYLFLASKLKLLFCFIVAALVKLTSGVYISI